MRVITNPSRMLLSQKLTQIQPITFNSAQPCNFVQSPQSNSKFDCLAKVNSQFILELFEHTDLLSPSLPHFLSLSLSLPVYHETTAVGL